jgi:N-acetylglucosaminyl-diphospho-decaprenol L-rhamnosyltransferase
MAQFGVTVVVVSFNTRDKLRKCLEHVRGQAEVIVIDNASHDGSAQMVRDEFPAVKLIAETTNLGFGKANNVGEQVASQPLVLYLNSDAYVEPGAIDRLAAVFKDPSIVAAGARLLNLDGSLQVSTANRLTLWAVFCEQLYLEKVLPDSRLFSPYWNTRRILDLPEPADTEQVMGAAMMVRRGLESFDERYFLYCEDTDLCLRLRRHGRIVYVKGACVTHELGSSSSADPIAGVARYNLGKETYFRIHRGVVAQEVCAGLNWAGALLRAVFWTLKCGVGSDALGRQTRNGFWRIVGSKIWRRRRG